MTPKSLVEYVTYSEFVKLFPDIFLIFKKYPH